MSDPETRNEIVDVIKEACALRTVLTGQKPCPYFGASGACLDCTFDWVTIAASVRKVAERRRASYEKEQEKVKRLTAEAKEREAVVAELDSIVSDLDKGMSAITRVVEFGMEKTRLLQEAEKKAAAEAEEVDARKDKS